MSIQNLYYPTKKRPNITTKRSGCIKQQSNRPTNTIQKPTVYATSKQLFLDVVNQIPLSKHIYPFCDNQQRQLCVMLLNFISSHNIEANFSKKEFKALKEDTNQLIGTLLELINNNVFVSIEVSDKGEISCEFNKEISTVDKIYCLSTSFLDNMPNPIKYAYATLLAKNVFISNFNDAIESFDAELISEIKGIPLKQAQEDKKEYINKEKEIRTLAKKYNKKELAEYNTKSPLETSVKKLLLEVENLDFSMFYHQSDILNPSIEDEGAIELYAVYLTYFENNSFGEFLLNDIEERCSQIGVARPLTNCKYTSIEDTTTFNLDIENKFDSFNNYLDVLTLTIYNCYV